MYGLRFNFVRDMCIAEFKQVGEMMAEVLSAVSQSQDGKAPLVEVMIPLVATKRELDLMRDLVAKEHAAIKATGLPSPFEEQTTDAENAAQGTPRENSE